MLVSANLYPGLYEYKYTPAASTSKYIDAGDRKGRILKDIVRDRIHVAVWDFVATIHEGDLAAFVERPVFCVHPRRVRPSVHPPPGGRPLG
jgi:hypothetical protein